MKFHPFTVLKMIETKLLPCAVALALVAPMVATVRADETPQKLPFVQDWSNPALINAENDWAGVPGFMGYRGDKLASKPGVNPQTVTADGNTTPVNVIANQKNPNSLRTGGIAEFDTLANPTIAMKGSANAAAPILVLNLDTRGKQNIAIGYKLRDLDGSANNAVQPVALQYRIQATEAYIDIPAAFAPDATTGPGVATLITPIVVVLPENAANQALLQVRWVTCNAEGNDEWVGIDDIAVIGDDILKALTNPSSGEKTPAVKKLKSPKEETKP